MSNSCLENSGDVQKNGTRSSDRQMSSWLDRICKTLRVFDIRFPESEERKFRATLERQMLYQCIIASILVVCGGLYFHLLKQPGQDMQWDLADPRTLCNVVNIVGLFVLVLVGAFASLRVCRGCFERVHVEYVAAFGTATALITFFFRSQWYAVKLYGMSADDLDWEINMPADPEMQLVLLIDMCLTGVCLWIPIRTCTLWLLPTLAMALFFTAAMLGTPTGTPWIGNCFNLICLAMMSSWGAYRQEQQNRAKFRAQDLVEAQQTLLQTQEQAVYRMLDRFCDCYVHINADSIVVDQKNPRFSAMLFAKKNDNLEGSNFRTYLASEEDRARFGDAVGRTATDNECTEMLPLHMRDSRGKEFQVHAYCACFRTAVGEPRFLVGLVEANERIGESEREGQANGLPVGRARTGTTSVSSASHQADLETLPSSVADEMAITILDDADLTILSITPGVTAMSGPVPAKASFRSWVRETKGFETFLQKIGNEFMQWTFDDLVLRTPAAKSLGKEFLVEECVVKSIGVLSDPFLSDPELDPGSLCYRLSFEGVMAKHASKEKRKKSPRPSMQSAPLGL